MGTVKSFKINSIKAALILDQLQSMFSHLDVFPLRGQEIGHFGFTKLENELSFHCANTFMTVNLIGGLATPL